jgi:hypothetical protein
MKERMDSIVHDTMDMATPPYITYYSKCGLAVCVGVSVEKLAVERRNDRLSPHRVRISPV